MKEDGYVGETSIIGAELGNWVSVATSLPRMVFLVINYILI